MPFTDDCRDRSEPAPGAPDALRQLDRLTTIAEQLGAAELSVLLLVAERLLEGRRRYGALNLATDPRDWQAEGLAEILDCVCYLSCALLRGRP